MPTTTQAAARWKTLYAGCLDPVVTYAYLEAETLAALAPLTVAQLREVARMVGKSIWHRRKSEIVADFARTITERKASWERCERVFNR